MRPPRKGRSALSAPRRHASLCRCKADTPQTGLLLIPVSCLPLLLFSALPHSSFHCHISYASALFMRPPRPRRHRMTPPPPVCRRAASRVCRFQNATDAPGEL
jgi:hypothetical protein